MSESTDASRRPSLLIVDDEVGPRESLRMVFKETFDVYCASTGREALSILQEREIDVVTLDLRMPEMSGVVVLDQMREIDPDVEIVVVTGYGSLDTALRGLRRGIFDYVSKPFEVAEISKIVGEALARRRERQRARYEKQAFLANLSHGFRTPLNAIIGYNGILREELTALLDQYQSTAMDRIESNSKQLYKLIEDILLLNSLEGHEVRPKPRAFDFAGILRDSVQRFSDSAARQTVDLELAMEHPVAPFCSDADRVAAVASILIDNGIKFTPAGGRVVVRGKIEHPRETAVLEVTDSGIGMAPDQLKRVLDGLFQVDSSSRRRFGGLGLGIRIARSLTELLGGDLSAESHPGRGSRFIATFPRFEPAAMPAVHELRSVVS